MSDDQPDTKQIEADLIQEKLDAEKAKATTLEGELAKYKQAEEERNKSELEKDQEARFDAKLKAEKEAIESAMEAKFESLVQRQSTNGNTSSSKTISFEDYKKLNSTDKEKYDTAVLKAALPGVF